MRRLRAVALLLVGLCSQVFGQDLKYEDYTWESEAKLHELSEADKGLSQVVLKDKTAIEFAFGDGMLFQYELVHKIIKVNSNEAIEKNNKVYLPLYGVEEVLINKARVITSNGKVKELDKSNIKEAQDEENRFSYKYYAIEGVDIGSEIEYIYFMKSQSRSTGSSIGFQDGVERRNVSFEIISPESLVYTAKSYNGFPEMVFDSSLVDDDKNYLKASISKIEAIEDEDFSNYNANMMQVSYKLFKNKYLGNKELYTYKSFAELIYQNLQGNIEKQEAKAVKKLVKGISLPNGSEEEKIRAVEDFVKGKYNITNARIEGLDNIETIIENKHANSTGITRLFCAIYKQLGIDYRIVMTSNRYKDKFDKDFESYIPLDELLLYFPKIEKFMAPTEVVSRLGLVPSQWTHNYGLFVKPVELGNYKSAVGEVQFIPALPSKATGDVMVVEMKFNDFYDSEFSVKRELLGYYAQNYQSYYDFINEEQTKQLNEAIVAYVTNDAELLELKVENTGLKYLGKKPLVVSTKIDGAQFIEKAGPNYLFKIGDVIGPQAEMYQDKERKLPVENDYNRFYDRTIKFDIPEGYEIKNLSDLSMDIAHKSEDRTTCAFISEYKVEGATVTVNVYEWYEQIEYPKSDFEAYRKVINAAADFNKIVLVLQKK